MTDHSSPENAVCYVERSAVRQILIGSNVNNEDTNGLLQEVDALPIVTAEDFRIRAQSAPDAWCQPMDQGKHTERTFLLYFEDADKGIATYTDEAEARRAFQQATLTWNCYLFGALPLSSPKCGGSNG